jgi:hypothetical protein
MNCTVFVELIICSQEPTADPYVELDEYIDTVLWDKFLLSSIYAEVRK